MNRVREYLWDRYVLNAPDWAWRSRRIYNCVATLCAIGVYRTTPRRKSC